MTEGGRLTVDIDVKTDTKGVETSEVRLDIQPLPRRALSQIQSLRTWGSNGRLMGRPRRALPVAGGLVANAAQLSLSGIF